MREQALAILEEVLTMARHHLSQIRSQDEYKPSDSAVLEKYGKLALMLTKSDTAGDDLDHLSDDELRQLALGDTNDNDDETGETE